MTSTLKRALVRIDGPSARKNELAQIHIAIADLVWDDDHYRAILFAKTGKRSAGELDSTGRKRFIEHLKACGWTGGNKAPAPRYSKQQWHALMLWRDLGKAGALTDKSDAALNAFIQGQCSAGELRFLGTGQASVVIEALKSWLKRAKAK
jgi:phage gp16-like protein